MTKLERQSGEIGPQEEDWATLLTLRSRVARELVAIDEREIKEGIKVLESVRKTMDSFVGKNLQPQNWDRKDPVGTIIAAMRQFGENLTKGTENAPHHPTRDHLLRLAQFIDFRLGISLTLTPVEDALLKSQQPDQISPDDPTGLLIIKSNVAELESSDKDLKPYVEEWVRLGAKAVETSWPKLIPQTTTISQRK